jgi:hypothetical protein
MKLLTSIKTWKAHRREKRWTYEDEQKYQKLKAESTALDVLKRVISSN